MAIDDLFTAAGHVIKIKPEKGTCIVFLSGGQPELVASGQRESMEQSVPTIAFVGRSFELVLTPGVYSLVGSQGGRLRIPYRTSGDTQPRHIAISTHSQSDQFPVLASHFENVKQLMGQGTGGTYRYIVLDPGVERIDTVSLRVGHPDSQILIVKPAPSAPAKSQHIDTDRVRANDLLETERGKDLVRNPVFLARLHLRNMELDQVGELLLQWDMSSHELEFVQSFLGIMLRNEHDKAELKAVASELQHLHRVFGLASLLGDTEPDAPFDTELDQGIVPEVAVRIRPLLEKRRAASESHFDRLRLWEWSYRLKKVIARAA